MKDISVLIPTFRRNKLLELNLRSLANQPAHARAEVIVLDDTFDGDEECKALVEKFGVTYVHSGATKADEHWRIPGFAINIGAKKSSSDALLICCAEMFHVNESLDWMLRVVGPKVVGIPRSVKDDKGSVTSALALGRKLSGDDIHRLRGLDTKLPFFMGIHKSDFFYIGGYDEDFTGVCFDDNDLTERLVAHGCSYEVCGAEVVHLFHHRLPYSNPDTKARWNHNKALYEGRRGSVIRNEGREWGKL